MAFRWIKELFRPPFVGELKNGIRVYSTLAVEMVTPDEITFTNGSYVNTVDYDFWDGKVVVVQAEGSTFDLG